MPMHMVPEMAISVVTLSPVALRVVDARPVALTFSVSHSLQQMGSCCRHRASISMVGIRRYCCCCVGGSRCLMISLILSMLGVLDSFMEAVRCA